VQKKFVKKSERTRLMSNLKNITMEKDQRIHVVNEIIKEIASRGRKFFSGKYGVAELITHNGRLYMKSEHTGCNLCLSTKFGYQPKGWTHGGTLWGLTKDFKEFIQSGNKSNGENGYGGLFCPHWGYSEADMKAIQEKAKSLNYL